MPATLEEIEKRLATAEERLDKLEQLGSRVDGHDRQLNELREELGEQRRLLNIITEQLGRVNRSVTEYTMRFDAVDAKLGEIVETLRRFVKSELSPRAAPNVG